MSASLDALLTSMFEPALAKPKKRSLTVAGHRTSITLEDAFWSALKAIAAEADISVPSLVAAIDAARGPASLSAALRVFALNHSRGKSQP